ncbi:MAG TPA: hypothetical protein PKY81_10385 [bacterium]|nr:hypothetical protein [bacterium]
MSEPSVEINETHFFQVNDATKYGIEGAIIINNLRYWILKNKANRRHFYDGHWWTYNSIKAFAEIFPYWTERQIRYILDKLKEENIILTANYNKNQNDQTLWYAFIDQESQLGIKTDSEDRAENQPASDNKNVKCSSQKCQMDLTNLSNGFDKNVRPLPDNKPDNKPDINIFPKGNKSISDEIDPNGVKPEQSQISKTGIKSENINEAESKTIFSINAEIDKIIGKWNKELAEPFGLPAIRKPNPDLKEKIKRRLREKDFDFDKIIGRIKESDFLLGKTEKNGSHSNWSLTLDFIVRNESNYLKILFTDNYHRKRILIPDGKQPNKKTIEFMSNVDKHIGRLSFQEFRVKFFETYKNEYFECIRNYWGRLKDSDKIGYNQLKKSILMEIEKI